MIATGIAALASPAMADEITVTVSYADLDLASPADVTILQARLDAALRRACAKDTGPEHAAIVSECVESGLANGDKVISEHRERALAAAP